VAPAICNYCLSAAAQKASLPQLMKPPFYPAYLPILLILKFWDLCVSCSFSQGPFPEYQQASTFVKAVFAQQIKGPNLPGSSHKVKDSWALLMPHQSPTCSFNLMNIEPDVLREGHFPLYNWAWVRRVGRKPGNLLQWDISVSTDAPHL